MKLMLLTLLAAAAILSLVSSPILAHHGNSAYDEKSPITITGTVTEFVWSNPHCQIYLDVNDKGKLVHWSLETQSPGILRRAGWTRSTLKGGDKITITLAAARNGEPVGFSGASYGKIVFADGRVLTMREQEPAQPGRRLLPTDCRSATTENVFGWTIEPTNDNDSVSPSHYRDLVIAEESLGAKLGSG
jgi:hypothetical protein